MHTQMHNKSVPEKSQTSGQNLASSSSTEGEQATGSCCVTHL